MLDQIKSLFLERSRRDQLMLLILAAALVAYLIYLLVIVPLNKHVAEQELQLSSLHQSHGRVNALAAQVIQMKDAGPSRGQSGDSLAQQVDNSLRQNGLAMQGLQTGANGEVRLRLQGVEYQRLLRWLYDMEVAAGVQVVSLSVVNDKDPGRVIANVRLKQG